MSTSMSDQIPCIIDNHIYVWSSIPSFAPMAEILRNDRDILEEKLQDLTAEPVPKGNAHDTVRLFILNFAFEHLAGQITSEHFTMFRDPESVEGIFEDSYGIKCRPDRDGIVIPYQNEVLKILIHCLFHRERVANEKDLLCFLHMFSRTKPKERPTQDSTIGFRLMIWFICLAIEILKTESAIRSKGLEYFSYKFRELLDRTIDGTITDEKSYRLEFEENKWEKTLWGWLQDENRREFARKLKHHFNMENRMEKVEGCLFVDQKNVMLEQVMLMFCK